MATLEDLLGKQEGGGLTLPEPVEAQTDDVQRVIKNNERDRSVLSLLGEKDPTAEKKPSFIDKLFGVLDVPGAGVRTAFYNAIQEDPRKDRSILAEIEKSLKGEDRLEGADILKELGVKNKWGLMLGGLAVDILLDPTTYLTGGYSSATKLESTAQLGKLALDGVDAARLADAGVDALKYADKVDDAGRVAAGLLDVDDSRKIADWVRKSIATQRGDAGGIKLAGLTVAPVQGAVDKAAYKAKDVARLLPGSEWFEKAFIYGDFTPVAREGNEVLNAGLKMALGKAIAGKQAGGRAASELEKQLKQLVPDDTTRSLVTFGIGRQFGNFADQGGLKALYETGDTAAIQKELLDLYNPTAVTDTVKEAYERLGKPLTDETLGKVQEAATLYHARMDDLVMARGEVGLPNGTRYMAPQTVTDTIERQVPFERTVPPQDVMATEVLDFGKDAAKTADDVVDIMPSPMNPADVPIGKGGKPKTYKTWQAALADQIVGAQFDRLSIKNGVDVGSRVDDFARSMPEDALGILSSLWMGARRQGLETQANMYEGLFDDLYRYLTTKPKNSLEDLLTGPTMTTRQVSVGKTPETIERGVETVQEFVERSTGIPLSAGYVPGMSPQGRQTTLDKLLQRPPEAQRATQEAAEGLGLTIGDDAPLAVQNLLQPDSTSGEFLSKFRPSAYKSKEYANAEARLVEGGILTETDIATLAKAKAAKDYTDIAWQGFQNDLTKMLGMNEMTPELTEFFSRSQKAFTNDQATRGFLKAYDKTLNMWKRAATVYNFPRFPIRNSISNQYLMWADDLWNAADNERALRIVGTIKTKGIEALGDADKAIAKDALAQGVWTSAENLAEQVAGGGAVTKLGRLASSANEGVENWSRLAAYITATKRKGLSPEAAALAVDKALFDYAPEAMTTFERNFMKRLIPFYTWMRRSTPQLVETLVKRPGKISAVGHLVENSQAANPINTDVMPDWMREGGVISLPFKDKDGEQQVIPIQGLLPIGDLEKLAPKEGVGEGLPAPLRVPLGMGANFLENLSPLIKTPLEVIMNRDLYYGDAVQEFPGQVRRAPAYVEQFDDLVMKIPAVNEIWQAVKENYNVVEKEDPDSGEPYLAMDARAAKIMKDLLPWFNYVGRIMDDTPESEWSKIGRTIGLNVRSYEEDKFARQKAFDEQAQLDDLLRGLRSQGRDDEIDLAREMLDEQKKTKKVTLADILAGGGK